MATSRRTRIVSTDPTLEAELVKQKEELRICREVRSANLDKLKAVAQEAMSNSPDGGTKIMRSMNAPTPASTALPSESAVDNLRKTVEKHRTQRSDVLGQLKETAYRVLSDSRDIRLPGQLGGPLTT